MEDHRWRTWRVAMTQALYGEAGFYKSVGSPGRTFRTSAHVRKLWAVAIQSLALRVEAATDDVPTFTVVDVGAGGGELLASLAATAPLHWSLAGVDLAPRPRDLPERVTWSAEAPERFDGLLIANELLDVVPVDVVERCDGMARQVEVTPDGEEELGGLVTGRDAQWLSSWWPLADDGDRAEIGWPRDDLWRALKARLDRGVAVAIDYAAVPSHDVAGTMTSYRAGRQIMPTPDGSCDITAHVLFESLAEIGDELLTQREALLALGISGLPPFYDGHPTSFVESLSDAGAAGELIDSDGLGAFTWLVHAKGLEINDLSL